MLTVLEQGGDLHASIAQRMWGVADRQKRQIAKGITFGLIYGASVGSLEFRLNISREEAKDVTENALKAVCCS